LPGRAKKQLIQARQKCLHPTAPGRMGRQEERSKKKGRKKRKKKRAGTRRVRVNCRFGGSPHWGGNSCNGAPEKHPTKRSQKLDDHSNTKRLKIIIRGPNSTPVKGGEWLWKPGERSPSSSKIAKKLGCGNVQGKRLEGKNLG